MMEYNKTSLAYKSDEAIDLPLDASLLTMDGSSGPENEPASAGSISDALIQCIRDTTKVDIERIAGLAGADPWDVIRTLRGAIYCNPETWGGDPFQGWETADEYLSGNLRYKLVRARIGCKIHSGLFEDNVRALEALLPPEVKAEDIYITLGSPWIPAEIIDDFVNHLIQPHDFDKFSGTRHDEETGSWELPYKARFRYYVRNTSTFGTEKINAVNILERTLNMRTIRVTKEVPSPTAKSGVKRVLSREDTAAAQEKQKLIIDEFRRWVWKDEERKAKLLKIFESKYGCNVARRFDGRFLDFPGMSDEVSLFPYQKDAVARILFTPNTLLAHDVGAGKTYIMIAAAMELKRMGMARKSMFVVPNNLVEQWRNLFLILYPKADVLCVEPKDMEPSRIDGTLRRVADADCDGIIMAYSCFDRIPLSRKAHIEALQAEHDELMRTRRNRRKVTSKFDKRLTKIEKELSELTSQTGEAKGTAKSMICFNELGVDRLFVDEAHNYKNVKTETSIYGVYGISQDGSAKCDSMMDKVHYVQKTHGGGGVVMATGTPITNSISDIYVFQRYLQSGELDLLGLQTFDSWVAMFAEKTTEFEIAVDTGSYRLATRFSRFHNIPELTTILASIADFHSMDDCGDIPDFDGYTDILIPRSDGLTAYLGEISKRADKVHNHEVKSDEDNMLKITSDGRKAALDIRLVDETASVGMCKVSECAERVAILWHKTKADRLTQLVFCDTSTPKADFNVYDDLKQRLVDFGVAEAEIAYVHDAKTPAQRESLFENMREGKTRVLLGSTFKLGLGVNVQDRLIAIHHLDLPWRPADMVQREGRILRAGNINDKIEIYRYITEGSFDAYSWQLLETKQRFIADILSGTVAGRSGSEVDDTVLDYAEVKALALGNPLLKSRVETRNELSRLSVLHKKSIEDRLRLEQRYEELPDAIAAKELELSTCEDDSAFVCRDFSPMDGDAFIRKNLRNRLSKELYTYIMQPKDKTFRFYRGFMIVLPAGMSADYPYLYLVRAGKYRVDMSDKAAGILVRIDNFLDKMDEHTARVRREKELLEQELAETEVELAKADSYADLIDEASAKLEALDEALGVNELMNGTK